MTSDHPGPAAAAHGSRLPRISIFGLDFVDAPGIDEVADAMSAFTEPPPGKLPLVVTPNLDHLVRARSEAPLVVDATRHAAFVLPDGQPIVWASGWFGTRLRARLTGSDLFAELWDRFAGDGGDRTAVAVIAPDQRVADALGASNPLAARVVAPMLAEEDPVAIEAFARSFVDGLGDRRPRHVFVCLGQPKQVLVSLAVLDAWPDDAPAPLCYCVGAAADMYVGVEQRAPQWMQRAGLEFVHRLFRQPGRLARRYLRDALGFPRLLLEERGRRRSE